MFTQEKWVFWSSIAVWHTQMLLSMIKQKNFAFGNTVKIIAVLVISNDQIRKGDS